MTNVETKPKYKEEYEKFLDSYEAGVTSSEEVGRLIAQLSNYFAEYNMLNGSKEKHLNGKAAEIVNQDDEKTGKPLSVAKADILIKATEQYNESRMAKIHLENIDNHLNSLKKLQLGIGNEYQHMQNN